jgi:hypothetical protein
MQPEVRLHIHGPQGMLRGHVTGTIYSEASFVS